MKQTKLELIKNSYQESANLSEATFKLVNQLFGNYGLLVLEPNKKKSKKTIYKFFKKRAYRSVFISQHRKTNK